MIDLIASIALMAATPEPVCMGLSLADRRLSKIANRCVELVHPAVRVRLGNLPMGTLYTFQSLGDHDFTSWLLVGDRKLVIYSEPDEAGWHSPVSVFNVKRSDGYCIVILRATVANYLGDHPKDERPSYDGLVSCLSHGQPELDQRLSNALVGKRTAAAARKALAPLLVR